MTTKKVGVVKEVIGLNSIRDYFINTWDGVTLVGAAEAQAFVTSFTKERSEEELLECLREGKHIAAFIKDFDKSTIKFNEEDSNAPVKLRIINIDTGIAVILLAANRYAKGNAKWLNAELEGQQRILIDKSFPKKHIDGWMLCQEPDKLLCIDEVVKFLNSENLLEAFKNYNQYFDREQYNRWRSEYSIRFRMSRARRQLISKIIKAIHTPTRKK